MGKRRKLKRNSEGLTDKGGTPLHGFYPNLGIQVQGPPETQKFDWRRKDKTTQHGNHRRGQEEERETRELVKREKINDTKLGTE